jgi:Flp pilus assembly protein TadG
MQNNFVRFLRNTTGNTAIMFSLAAVPLMLGAGAAIDMVRANQARTILQAAADAAALAGASSGKTTDVALNKIVKDYVKTNGAEDVLTSVKKVKQSLDKTKRTFTVDIDGKLKTNFMLLGGISEMDISAKAEVNIGGNALEVALVLDNTASMNSEGRLDALKVAAKDLVKEVLSAKDTGAYVKVGIVPFSDYVNVGISNRTQSWINVPADSTTTQNICSTNYPDATSSNCHMETGSWNNDGVPTPYTYEVCDWVYGSPVTTCSDQTWNNTWNGCVGSRSSTLDTKIGSLATKYPGLQNTWCPQEVTLFDDNESALGSKIDAMVGSGNTYIPSGVLWGWNLLDSNAPLASAKTKTWMKSNGGTKSMVVMTDGDNTLSADYPYHWGSDVPAANAKTAELCENVKKEGIVVYTVAFKVSNTTAKDMLVACASDPAKAFSADDPAALLQAFRDIAKSLLAMRLTK